MEAELRNPVLRFVVHGHVLLALGAGAQVWWIGEQWSWNGDERLALAACFATFATYCTMRLFRLGDASAAGTPVMRWYARMAKATRLAVLVALAAAFASLGSRAPDVLARLWPVVLVAGLYLLPIGSGRWGLRSVPGLKSLLVAGVWAGGTVLLGRQDPRVVQGITPFILATQFCFFLALAIAFDIRDRPLDPPRLRTIPQLIGQRAARVLAVLLLLPLACSLLIMVAISYHPIEPGWRAPAVDWALALPLLGVASSGWLIARSSPGRPWWHWLALDSMVLCVPVLSIIGAHL